MTQPNELKLNLPMEIANGVISTTDKVWDILVAGKNGDLEKVNKMVDKCPELIYAQCNYRPPVQDTLKLHSRIVPNTYIYMAVKCLKPATAKTKNSNDTKRNF